MPSTNDRPTSTVQATTVPDSPGALPDEVQEVVDGYSERLDECVDKCVLLYKVDPEAFLWNARRAAEAICLLLLTVKQRTIIENPWEQESKDGKRNQPSNSSRSLEEIIATLHGNGTLTREVWIGLDTVRNNANPGVHLSSPTRPQYDLLRSTVARTLPMVVRWLCEKSIAKPYLGTRERMMSNLDKLRDECAGEPPPEVQILQLRQQVHELTEQATRLRQAELDAIRRVVEVEGTMEREITESRSRVESRSAWSTPLMVIPALLLGLLAGAGLVILGGHVSGIAARVSSRQIPQAAEAQPVATPVQDDAPTVAPPVAVEPTPAVEPPVVPPQTCLPGMVRIEARTIRISQPKNKGTENWPAPTQTKLDPIPVPAFCVDFTPLLWSGVKDSPMSRYNEEACDGQQRDRDPSARATCMTRAEAESFCATNVPNGRLPTIAEWESLARDERWPSIKDGRKIHAEWVNDRYPPAIFHRGGSAGAGGDGMVREIWLDKPPGQVAMAWERQDPDIRMENTGFRCVMPLGNPREAEM